MNKKCCHCSHLNYKDSKTEKSGYYCYHPDNILGPRLVKESARYQCGYRTPRWCPLKELNKCLT